MCTSIIDYYILGYIDIDAICLANFASSYTNKGQKHKQATKPYVIRSMRYSKHRDIKNYCREQLMLYDPYRVDETTIKQHHQSWQSSYVALEKTGRQNEQTFRFVTGPTWGDLDHAIKTIETQREQISNIDSLKENQTKNIVVDKYVNEIYENYDFQSDLQHFKHTKNLKLLSTRLYEIVKQLNILEDIEYYNLMQKLNPEESKLVADVIARKLCSLDDPINFLLTGGARTRKTFTSLAIFQSLVCIHNGKLPYNRSQLKGIITTYTGKATLNTGGVTMHSTFSLPFNNNDCSTLNSEKLDTLSKNFEQLHVVLIDEASLVGATTPYHIDKRLSQIVHKATSYFFNVDLILSGDLYQVGLVKDSLIFENP